MSDRNTTLAFRIIVVLFAVVLCETIVLGWCFFRERTPGQGLQPYVMQMDPNSNIIQDMYPEVDFRKVYPELDASEIDRLQRECFSVRYVYSPFVQFEPVPVSGRFVNITHNGFRLGSGSQLWPPDDDSLVVFVFGGSTTFGYGVADDQTVVSQVQRELNKLSPGKGVACYNFGRGYFFSTQERLLFEILLMSGYVPDVAVFIDGLNEFQYPEGRPQMTDGLFRFTAPDLKPWSWSGYGMKRSDEEAVKNIIHRYRDNSRMIEAVASRYGVTTVLAAQPVPFFEFDMNSGLYSFTRTANTHRIVKVGYPVFKQAALQAQFGPHFVWCGDAFEDAGSIMYADGTHYSPEGNSTLARTLVERIGHLIEGFDDNRVTSQL